MNTISYSDFRANLASVFDRVNENHEPILITRRNGKQAVLVSLEYFQALTQQVKTDKES